MRAALALHPLLALLLALPARADEVRGWRHDGTGHVEGATPPSVSAAADARWTHETPAWGNGSPIRFGDMVCATSEPTTVFCVDAATGALRWRATNDAIDTFPAEARDALAARIAKAPELEATLRELQRSMSKARRDARRAGTDASEVLSDISAQLDATKRDLDAVQVYRTPPNLDLIGYASPTPVTDGEALYVGFGNGVVSRFEADGTKTWSVWLGPAPRPMTGYDFGSVASPQLLGDTLVVAHNHLQALDPATGRVRWKHDETWRHYGTPGLATVDGLELVLVPDGRVVRASDGEVLLRDLGDIWYTGPIAQGRRVYWVGSKGDEGRPGNAKAWAVDLARTGDTVTATPRWSRDMPSSERIYATPVVHEGLLYALTNRGTLQVLDADSGDDVARLSVQTELADSDAYQNLLIVDDHLWVGSEAAEFVWLSTGRTPELKGRISLPGDARATPLFDGGAMYIRTLSALYAFGR